jgi:hypothetical protein
MPASARLHSGDPHYPNASGNKRRWPVSPGQRNGGGTEPLYVVASVALSLPLPGFINSRKLQ